MKSATPPQARSRRWNWIKSLLWLLLALVILLSICLYYYGPWIAYHLATGPLGGSEVIATDASCGDGEYRIVVHQYRSGDGYLELTNRSGKVFDSSTYSRGIDYTPFKWRKNCKKVMVGSNDGLSYLEVKE